MYIFFRLEYKNCARNLQGADIVFWVAVPKDSTLIPANIDQPAGIAVTEPYYHDNIAHVGLKKIIIAKNFFLLMT